MLRTVGIFCIVSIPLNLAAQTESSDLSGSLTGRAESNNAASSSNVQISSLDASLQRKNKKKNKEVEEEQEAFEDEREEEHERMMSEEERKLNPLEEAAEKFNWLREQNGVVLRGVIHVVGFDFAVYMNRMSVKKKLHDNWFKRKTNKTKVKHSTISSSRKYWLAEYEMYFKLLHFAYEAAMGAPQGKKRTAKKYAEVGAQGDLQQVLDSGFVGRAKLVGFWNDENSHFRLDNMKEKDVSDLSWMHHLMMPWKDLDCRFDNEGASCRADFTEESKGWFARTFGSEPERFLSFRLDAHNPMYDPKKIWVGVGTFDDVDYSIKMYYEKCTQIPKSIQCPLEMRPLVVGNSGLKNNKTSLEAREQKYMESAGGGLGGPWFSYMGMKGTANLRLIEDGNNYKATTISTECGGNAPCPYIPNQAYDLQLLAHVAILDPHKGAEEVTMLYPIYNDFLMQEDPDGLNLQGIVGKVHSVSPLGDKEAAIPSPGSAREEERIAAVQADINEHEGTLSKLLEELKDCQRTHDSSLVQTSSQRSDSHHLQVMSDMQDELDSLKKEVLRLKQM